MPEIATKNLDAYTTCDYNFALSGPEWDGFRYLNKIFRERDYVQKMFHDG